MRAQTVAEYMRKRELAARANERMQELRDRVRCHVEKLFVTDNIKVTEFPLLPGGLKLEDQSGQSLLFYWDILSGSVQKSTT